MDFLLRIIILFIIFTNGGNSSKDCRKLSNECRIIGNENKVFVCNYFTNSFVVNESEITTCKNNHQLLPSVNLKASSEILDRSHNLTSLSNFLIEINRINNPQEIFFHIYINYLNLKGIDLNASFSIDDSHLINKYYYIYYNIKIFDSKFQFFLNNKLQVSCEDYFKSNLSESTSFLQAQSHRRIHLQISLHFWYTRYPKIPLCPFYFKNIKFRGITFNNQINTFYKKNYLTFSTVNNSAINASIEYLSVLDSEKINIDSNSFLNKYVFQNIVVLRIYGEIRSIEKDIFKSFKQLTEINFEIGFFGQLSRKGIEWISSINFNLDVNLSNKSDLDRHKKQTKYIKFVINKHSMYYKRIDIDHMKLFLDEDFCLFKDYPFNKLVIIYLDGYLNLFSPNYTCTVQWILQHYSFYVQYGGGIGKLYSKFLDTNTKKCDFVKILDNCNRRKFQTRHNDWTINDTKETTIMIEFIFILLLPIICFIGLLFNIMIIYTLSIKDNKKSFGIMQYSYLKMISVSNIIILIISILSPLYECQKHEGIYCSPYHKLIFVQYYKIIFGEFVCSVFKFLSNFAYVGFSICRLSMIGKEQSKITKFFSELPIVYYIIASTIISVALSVVKIFIFEVNTFHPEEEYPISLDQKYITLFQNIVFTKKARLVEIFNLVSDVTNYLLFIPINFTFDIILILKMKKALTEKLNLEVKKEKEILFRMKILVLTFLLFNFLMKLPPMLKSIFDMVHVNVYIKSFSESHYVFIYRWYCSYSRICPTYDKVAFILFIISILANSFFSFLFDKNLKFGFRVAFSKLTSSKKSHLEYVEVLQKSRSKK